LAQICNKSIDGWGFAPDPTGGAYNAPQTPRWFRGWGPRGKEGGRGGEKGERNGGRRGEVKGGEGRGRRRGSPGMPKSRVGKPN